jgi:hypothetical protein
MSPEQAEKAVAEIHHSFGKLRSMTQTEVWQEALAPLDARATKETLKRLIRSSTKLPTVDEFVQLVRSTMRVTTAPGVKCAACDGNGWVYAQERIVNNNFGYQYAERCKVCT